MSPYIQLKQVDYNSAFVASLKHALDISGKFRQSALGNQGIEVSYAPFVSEFMPYFFSDRYGTLC
jgi:hypothetical protein